MPGQTFERDVVHAFNDYFRRSYVRAIAYRHYQMRYQPQLFDVLVDSRSNELYLAIECKSIDVSTVPQLYFKQHFSWKDGVCQIERESTWLDLSGRNGFLCVELRRVSGKKSSTFFVPWRVLYHAFESGAVGLTPDQITWSPSITKAAGKYTIDDDFIDDLVKSLDGGPRDIRKAKGGKR